MNRAFGGRSDTQRSNCVGEYRQCGCRRISVIVCRRIVEWNSIGWLPPDGASFYSPTARRPHKEGAMSGIRTILADDAVAVRNTMAQLLALEPDIDVLGE